MGKHETSMVGPRVGSGLTPGEVHEVLARNLLTDGFSIVFDLEKSHGSWLVDARTGERVLDFFTFFASLPVGFNHPTLRESHWQERLLKAALNKPSNSDAYTAEMASFVEAFSEFALPAGFRHLFFIEGGALAVENALKAAFDWKTRKNQARGLSTEGSRILHFREAFHGRTGYTLSLTNTDPIKTDFFPKFDWPRVANPKLQFPVDPSEVERVSKEEKAAMAEIEEAFRNHPDEIAGIIIEPIQGEGGDNHFRGEFLHALREIADREEALLIFDEVQTGFGITGRLWAHEHFEVVPDLIAFGKKTQVCGMMASERVDEVKDNVFQLASRVNSTWGGNLVDMVRCEAYMSIIEREALVANAAEIGAYLLDQLRELSFDSGGKIHNVRGLGLMCAFDAPSPDVRTKIVENALKNRLLILPCGEQSARFRPPLNLSREEADEGLERLQKAIKSL